MLIREAVCERGGESVEEGVISVLVIVCRLCVFFFFQAEDGIRDLTVTGVQTCALPILRWPTPVRARYCSAARTPITVLSPVVWSVYPPPAFSGTRSG